MNFGVLLAVKDIDISVDFYTKVIGLDVIADFGANKTLSGGLALQTLDTWRVFIEKDEKEIIFANNASELYFESDDFDEIIERIKQFDIRYVHSIKEHSWGQRVARFYDPDHHIIEVGETLERVAKRFKAKNMRVEDIAIRMDMPIDNIIKLLE